MHPIDYNFMHAMATFCVTSKTGEVLETRDLLLTNGRGSVAEFNQSFLKRPGYKLERACDSAQAYFARAGVPFRLQFPVEHAAAARELERRGFVAAEPIPGMALSLPSPLQFAAPKLEIRQVAEATDLGHFQRVAFESFGFPVELAALALTEELVHLPHVRLFLGYVDAEPVCCSLLVVTGDMAGIHWVGTLAAFRGRGLGAAVTAHAVQVGAERGCRVASLQASKMGAPVYRRMGFATVREYLRYDSGSSQH
jgi:GNAT superfamily N-acetyltransferase